MRWTGLFTSAVVVSLLVAPAGCKDEPTGRSGQEGVRGKPTAPVEISYDVPDPGEIGSPVDVVVSVQLHKEAGDLRLSLTPGRGLDLGEERMTFAYGWQGEGATVSETVSVRREVEGVAYLNVFVSGTFGGRAMTRTGAVPVGDGERKLRSPAGVIRTDAEGRKVIEMPLPAKEE